MVAFLFYLLYIVLVINGEYEAYVTSNGTLNEYCNVTKPCGSLAIVLWNIEAGNIINQHITIYVNGHYSHPFNLTIDCNFKIHGNIIIIFDTNSIQSMNDWHPFINTCYNLNNQYNTLYQLYGEGSSIEFHHLIYENTKSLFIQSIHESIGAIHCYHCIFSNLYVSPNNTNHFMTIHHSSSFIDCLFENITITTMDDRYSVAFIDVSVYIDDAIIILENCTLNNIITFNHSTYFISIEPHIMHHIDMNINNILLNNLYYKSNYTQLPLQFIYSNTDSKFVNSKNQISMISSSFIGSIHILYIDQGIFDVNMMDIDIETPQYIKYSENDENILYLSTINIGQHSMANLRNIRFKTLLFCKSDDAIKHTISSSIVCEIPIGLLYNAGYCNATNITMISDYNQNDEYSTIRYIEYIDMDLSKMHHAVAIYNDHLGEININNLSFLNGANYHFLYNLRGTVVVNNFVSNNNDNEMNHIWKLKPMNLFINYGVLIINNSQICGCNGIGFQLFHGSLYIYHSTLSYLPLLIQSMYTLDAIYLDVVNISNIGSDIHYINPIYIASQHVSITNSIFNFISHFGILKFATIGLQETVASKLRAIEKRIINMNNNQFIAHAYSDWSISDINSTSKCLNGYIEILSPYSIVLTGNKFIHRISDHNNDALEDDYNDTMTEISEDINENIKSYNIPWIYLKTSMHSNCMASNIFYGYSLFIQNGTISSCKHPEIYPIIDHDDECWISLGKTNREYSSQTLFININTSISITLNGSSNIILDYVQFIGFQDIPIDIIGINNSLSMLDVLILTNNSNTATFEVPSYCHAICYQIVNNKDEQIRQLQLVCDEQYIEHNTTETDIDYIDIQEIAQRDGLPVSVTSWSPDHIQLVSNGLYPGGKILFNYTIMDMYDNMVDNNPHDLQIKLYSDPLNIDTILYINAGNDSCDQCLDGLQVSHITMKDVTKSFEISTNVIHDILTVNDLNITIINCPESFIISNQSICIKPVTDIWNKNGVEIELWITVIGIAVILTIVIVVYFIYNNQTTKKNITKEQSLTQYIHNPLVVLIGIGIYENKCIKNSDFIDGYFPDLAIEVDLENLSRLFRYLRYEVIGHETKLQWTKEEIMKFVEESAKEACEDKYDGVIVIISSNGIKNDIVTTDLKTISRESIHRAYSMQYSELRDKPRIFIYDCCIGTQRIKRDIMRNSRSSYDEERNGENIDNADDIDDLAMDHKLVQIHIDSITVQNKMNQMDGSYLLHEFGKRIISNIEEYQNGKCLGQILNDINEYRENTGKQQITNVVFNDNTRYLKLCINDNIKIKRMLNVTKNGTKDDDDINKNNDDNGITPYDRLCITRRKTAKFNGSGSNHDLNIPIERIYQSDGIGNRSVIGSNKASTTMSGTRKKDRFIRKKNIIKNKNKNKNVHKNGKNQKYKIITMQDDIDDIDEDTDDDDKEIEIIMEDEQNNVDIDDIDDIDDDEKEEEEKQEYITIKQENKRERDTLSVSINSSKDEDDIFNSNTMDNNVDTTTTIKTIMTDTDDEKEEDEQDANLRDLISQNVIEATDTDSSDTETESFKLPLRYAPTLNMTHRERKGSTKL